MPNFMHSKTFWVFIYPNMFLPNFVDIKHIYIPDFYQSCQPFIE